MVASALGIPSLLPFLKAVCRSKKSWQARHTGIKIVQQIAILMGCAILPHLRSLVEIIEHGEQFKRGSKTRILSHEIAELQKAFKLPPGKIFKVCVNLPQNFVKLGFLN